MPTEKITLEDLKLTYAEYITLCVSDSSICRKLCETGLLDRMLLVCDEESKQAVICIKNLITKYNGVYIVDYLARDKKAYEILSEYKLSINPSKRIRDAIDEYKDTPPSYKDDVLDIFRHRLDIKLKEAYRIRILDINEKISLKMIDDPITDLNTLLAERDEFLNTTGETMKSISFAQVVESWESTDRLQQFIVGIDSLDEVVSINPGSYVLLGAQPSCGKTAMVNQWIAAWAHYYPETAGLYLSLETPEHSMTERFIKHVHRTYKDKHAVDKIKEFDWYFCRTTRDSKSIENEIRQLKKVKRNLQFVCLDYVQLIDEKGKTEREAIEGVSKMLQDLSRELRITVVVLTQFDQGSYSIRPTMRSVKSASQLTQDADIVILMWNPDLDNTASRDDKQIEVRIAKQRDGPVRDIMLDFNGPSLTFSDPA